jgi:hypothetical protein
MLFPVRANGDALGIGHVNDRARFSLVDVRPADGGRGKERAPLELAEILEPHTVADLKGHISPQKDSGREYKKE